MDETDTTAAQRRYVLERALAVVATHPAISNVGLPCHDKKRGANSVDLTFEINLPSEWRRTGHSPSGIRAQEIVRFHFPLKFPLKPPDLSLRRDFNRNLPHMQPWLADGRPVPCVYDGDVTELLLRDGLSGLVNQTAVWLERAALGTLIDPNQGWEPVRRASYRDHVIADADALRRFVDRRGGHKFLRLSYLRIVSSDSRPTCVQARVSTAVARLTHKTIPNIFQETRIKSSPHFSIGESVALLVWPGKQPSGKPIINDIYLPETVASIMELKARAQLYGCGMMLDDGLHWLAQCLRGHPPEGPFCLVVVLMARRPYNVIGTRSPIELCPYVLDVATPDLYSNGVQTPVRPAGHHHAISRALLAQLSGSHSPLKHPRWTLVGAGSLGSKLALHLTRSGNGPDVVIDKSIMTPHNAARHALIPATDDMHVLWMNAKAKLLCDSLRGLHHAATPMVTDAISILASKSHRVCPKGSWALVNAIASLAVREALAKTEQVPTRVIETSLFSHGQVGVITVEGPDRNPNTNDLMAECYALLAEDSTLSHIVFGADDGTALQSVGQGCSSLTMPMSDGRLSLFAAGMAEHLLQQQHSGLPTESGQVIIGTLTHDGSGLQWRIAPVPPVACIRCKAESGTWRIHIHQRAAAKIELDVGRWSGVETGGVVMGRLSDVSRTVHVVDVLDASDDSKRSAGSFVLGTNGLARRIERYSSAAGWSLYCLGTWHSHMSASDASAVDRATTRAISVARLAPSVALIHTPVGFRAYLSEPDNVSGGSK